MLIAIIFVSLDRALSAQYPSDRKPAAPQFISGLSLPLAHRASLSLS